VVATQTGTCLPGGEILSSEYEKAPFVAVFTIGGVPDNVIEGIGRR